MPVDKSLPGTLKRSPKGHTKAELYVRARDLGVEGRSTMTKLELASAVGRKQR